MNNDDNNSIVNRFALFAERIGFTLWALLLLTGLTLLIALSGLSYRAVLRSQSETDALRDSLGYIRTQVKNHDYSGGVSLRGDTLVLNESDGENKYELRICVRDGYLTEEYCATGEECRPDSASRLIPTEFFSVKRVKDDLLLVEAGEDQCYIRLFAASLKEGLE